MRKVWTDNRENLGLTNWVNCGCAGGMKLTFFEE